MIIRNILALCVALSACACAPKGSNVESNNPIIEIEGGKVQGTLSSDSSLLMYKGIPYAAAPVGELRWQKPQPVTPWEGVLVADHFSAAAMQHKHGGDDGQYGTEFYPEDPEYSEDCLYLNIWAPADAATDPDANYPVAMWIHGGGFATGWGYEREFDGEAFAKNGVILVTINYRLGILGFLSHPELSAEQDGTSGNYGMYDQIAALKWVKNNIGKFGGNPNNVTVFGQSAGGGSVRNLVTSPLSKDLINKAIFQSAGGLGEFIPTGGSKSQADFDNEGKDVMDKYGFPSLKAMREATAEDINAVAGRFLADNGRFLMLSPHMDGVCMTEDFTASVYNNTIADIPYMLGCNTGDNMDTATLTNFASVRNSLSKNPTYCYLFSRDLPDDGRPCLKGAFHSSELWYVFNTLSRCWRPFTEGDYKLSEEMVSAWTNFCKYGNPNGQTDGEWKASTKDAPFVHEFKVKE